MFSYNGVEGIGQYQRLPVSVQFARWRYRGQSLPSPKASCLVITIILVLDCFQINHFILFMVNKKPSF